MNQNNIRKLVSNIICHRFYSPLLTFKVRDIRNELRKKYKIKISLREASQFIEQHLRKGIIKYQDPYEDPTKHTCERSYRISIDTDILLWFMKGIEYGQRIDEMNDIKYDIPPKFYPPKISIQYKDK